MTYPGFYIELIKYYLFSRHKYGYGIHSPFVYDLIKSIVRRKFDKRETENLEKLRKEMNNSQYLINHIDFGSEGININSRKKTISSISRRTAIKRKYGELLFQLVRKFRPDNILELGTSLGISTMYMALASPDSKINTIEGCLETAEIAENNFKKLNLKNICLSKGKFDDVLQDIISKSGRLDFVFFDGNHKMKPTLDYFNLCLKHAHKESVFIFDDINWSTGMKLAWKEIKAHNKVTVSIDLFFMGIVFLNKDFAKHDYVVRY